jgi:protease-4
VIYIEGPIIAGKSQNLFGSISAGSTTIRAALLEALEDDDIRAVVVRVNSPGGSALASDIMWKAARRLGKKKPARGQHGRCRSEWRLLRLGSGRAHFRRSLDHHRFRSASWAASRVWSELMEDHLGITTTEYSRGKNAALYSMNRDWTEQEMAKIESFMNEVYGQFKDRIRTGTRRTDQG